MSQPRTRVFRHFDIIRRCGSIREASRHLRLPSSALNRPLLQSQDEIGSPLCDRLPIGLRLRSVCEIGAARAIHVLQDAARMEYELAALS